MRKPILFVLPVLLFSAAAFFSSSCFADSGNAAATVESVTPASDLRVIAVSAPASAAPALPVLPPVLEEPQPAAQPAAPAAHKSDSIISHMGIGVGFSSLGIGGQFAYKVFNRANVRVGFNFLSVSRSFVDSGITYNGDLRLQSFQATFDYFFLGPLHISAGALLYDGNHMTATVAVPTGQNFTLGSQKYLSQNPSLAGNGTLNFGSGASKVAPLISLGVGNLVGRHHFSVDSEIGIAYQGQPSVGLSLSGNVCPTANGTTCNGPTVNAATDSTVKANVIQQQNNINNDIISFKYARFYPILSLGVGWRF